MKTKVTSKMCMTRDVGINGNLFGGNMLAWMDEAAAIYAMMATGEPNMVSVRFAEIVFRSPVKEGEVLNFYCENPRQGHTSFTFDISAEVNCEERFRTECTFVAVNEHGSKKVIDWPKSITD